MGHDLPEPPAIPPKPAPPTRVRFLVVTLTTAMAVLLYLDRFCLSFTELYISEDLGLTNVEAGWLFSAFFWAYALAQVPSGWLSDRFGARTVLTAYIVGWSVFTSVMGVADSLLLMLVFRFGCGLAQAGAYPTSAAILRRWVPFSARALASGIVSTGGRIGGFVAPLLTAYLMVAFVPLETSSLLRPGDLHDVTGLCRRLEQTGSSPEARLSTAIRARMPHADSIILARDGGELVAGLNEVLKQRDLWASAAPTELPLPAETKALVEVPDQLLTTAQIERRNRLLLETVYPDQIHKIYGFGWRPVMYVYGLAGLVAALFFWLGIRDWPALHPACNAAEVALIEGQQKSPLAPGARGALRTTIPMRHILRSTSLWLSSLSQFSSNIGWVFLVTWLPRYLAEAHRVPALERGWMTSLPILTGMAGMLSGGWVSDRLVERIGLRWGRALPMGVTRLIAACALVACPLFHSPWAVIYALCLMTIATDLGVPAIWAYMQDVGGRNVGSVLGWGNMWGNLGAALSPHLLIHIKEWYGWNACFLACAAVYIIAGLTALGVDARIPVEPPESEGALA